jgi:hypothetical protein
MKSAALLLVVLLPVYSLSVPCVNAQTARNMPVQSKQTKTGRPPARQGAGVPRGGRTYFYPPRPGIAFRTYLPPTSTSSVDISVAEYDPPSPPITDTTQPPEDGDGPRGTRGQ